MRPGLVLGLCAIVALLAACSSATFPASSDAGIEIDLEASGAASMRVVAPSEVNAKTLAAGLAPATFGAARSAPPVADGPNAARIEVASAFDPSAPRFTLDAAEVVQRARAAGAGDVLLEICAPSGVPVTIEQGPAGDPDGACERWSFAPGHSAAPLALTLHPSAARLWVLAVLSGLMLAACGLALATLAVRRDRWSARRRARAALLGLAGSALVVAWLSFAAAAMDGNVDMIGTPDIVAALARIVAFLGLAAACLSAVIGVLALTRRVPARSAA
jgi:hypothetical protein